MKPNAPSGDGFLAPFNRLNDATWTWGPLAAWRPLETQRMGAVHFLLRGVSFGMLLLLYSVVIPVLFTLMTFVFEFHTLPVTPRRLRFFFLIFYWTWRTEVGTSVGYLVGIVVLLTLLSVLAWNRRAVRLQSEPTENAPPTASPIAAPTVWPPPPNLPDPL